jgi:DNA-binding response OmpR family regulator
MDTQAKKVILVADDEASIRQLLKRFFTEYAIIEAADGMEALETARSRHPDLIILDIMMPKMDGYTVCHKLKTEALTANIPVIMLTGLSYDLNAKLGQSMGANAYITKPFKEDELRSAIKSFLG